MLSRDNLIKMLLSCSLVYFLGSFTHAQASLIQLDLFTFGPATATPNTWELYAQTSVGDNDGIAGYNVPVLGADSLFHSVITQKSGATPVTGFTLDDATNDVIFGGQNSTLPSSVIYGIGNPAFLVPVPPAGLVNVGMPTIGSLFGPVLLASGTGNYLALGIGSASANVWSLGQSQVSGVNAEAANIQVFIQRSNDREEIPEPAPLALLSLGLAVLGFARRRKVLPG